MCELDVEYPKWVYLMVKRLREEIPDIDSVNPYPFYDSETYEFRAWMFGINAKRGKVTFCLALSDIPNKTEPDVLRRILDFHIKYIKRDMLELGIGKDG